MTVAISGSLLRGLARTLGVEHAIGGASAREFFCALGRYRVESGAGISNIGVVWYPVFPGEGRREMRARQGARGWYDRAAVVRAREHLVMRGYASSEELDALVSVLLLEGVVALVEPNHPNPAGLRSIS